jgi:hypothetical protein
MIRYGVLTIKPNFTDTPPGSGLFFPRCQPKTANSTRGGFPGASFLFWSDGREFDARIASSPPPVSGLTRALMIAATLSTRTQATLRPRPLSGYTLRATLQVAALSAARIASWAVLAMPV